MVFLLQNASGQTLPGFWVTDLLYFSTLTGHLREPEGPLCEPSAECRDTGAHLSPRAAGRMLPFPGDGVEAFKVKGMVYVKIEGQEGAECMRAQNRTCMG